MLISLFSWWYGQGWKQVIASLGPRLGGISEAFSVPQLLKTLFAPWRRIITMPGRSLEARFRAWADNMFSRVIGFIVRIFVLLAAFVSAAVVALLTVAEIILWPVLPLAVPVLIIMGLTA